MITLEEYLTMIEEELDRGRPVRFSNKITIDKEDILDIIVDIRSNVPDEINRAKKVIEDYEKIIAEAEARARKIIEETEKQARNMVNEHEIYKQAVEKADNYLEDTKKAVESWTLKSVEYVDQALENASNSLTNTIEKLEKNQADTINYFNDLNQAIYKNREQLRQ